MNLIMRGVLWYGLYLFLILLPLITAAQVESARIAQPLLVELAVGAGFVGFAIMALEFVLITRVDAVAKPFGEDSRQLFHNLMGITALGFILAHPLLLLIAGYPASCWLNPFSACANLATQTGALSLYALLILIVTSVWRVKLRISYEVWYLMHGLLALVILGSALGHVILIGRYTTSPVMQAIWVLYAFLLLGLVVWFKILVPVRNWNKKWGVVESRPEKGGAHQLVLKPAGHDGFNFQPGQFAWLKVGRTPFGFGQHPISLSGAGDVKPGGTIAFTIKNLGDWSGKTVPALKPGDTLWIDGPYGVMSMDREQAMGYVFIGGGIGITPLYSMCQTMAEREDMRPVVLFFGAREEGDLTHIDELQALTEHMNLTLVPVLSDPSDAWEGERGFIDAKLMEHYAPKQFRHFKFLICGPKPMMDAMERIIPSAGIPTENVLTERFDMA